jgi:hypothetical protein
MATMRKRKTSGVPVGESNSVPSDATVRLEVFHNGRRIARAGIPGYAVLSTTVTWVRRDTLRWPPGTKVKAEDLRFHVGGLDSNDPSWSRHVEWATPPLNLGDRIEIRVSGDSHLDPPTSEQKYPNQQRPEPPPENDPARTEIKGAILWPAPSGVYLRALDNDNGGPVVLSRRDALRMAKALATVAAGAPSAPSRRRRRRRR